MKKGNGSPQQIRSASPPNTADKPPLPPRKNVLGPKTSATALSGASERSLTEPVRSSSGLESRASASNNGGTGSQAGDSLVSPASGRGSESIATSPRRPSIPLPRAPSPHSPAKSTSNQVGDQTSPVSESDVLLTNLPPAPSSPPSRASGTSPRRPSFSHPRTPAPFPPLVSIKEKIKGLCQKQSHDEALQDNFGLYIPPCATRNQYSNATFDLTAEINDFIDSNRIVMLVSGESGSGKSFFCQSFIKSKSECYQPGDRIPIFCSLPTVRKLTTGLMSEVLSQHGFTMAEINTLRDTEKFLMVFDAYDETNSKENLFLKNELEKWDVRVIFTCRPSYFGDDKSYSRLFIPFKMQRPLNEAYQEVFVSPLVPGQIEQYIKQFLTVKDKELRSEIRARHDLTDEWLTPTIYKTWIAKIPGLSELTGNPFLLRITMEVLPGIVAEFQAVANNEEKFRMTSVKLYDNFVDKWFARQEVKLMGRGESVGRTFQTDCKKFAKALAKKMQERGTTVVNYQDLKSDDNPFGDDEPVDEAKQAEMKEFALFFSDELVPQDQGSRERLENRKRWRLANLIKKAGEGQWSFIHPEIRDYFVTLNIVGPQPRRDQAVQPAAVPLRGHRQVSQFRLMNRFNFQEAQELLKSEGIKIVFDHGEQNQKVVLGQGHFGKFRIAQQVANNRFAGVKKIRGEQLIKESEKEAIFQRELNGLDNVMPIWDSQLIKSKRSGENVLLQFMPLAGFGSGEKLIPLLQFIEDQDLKNKFLIHILKSLLTGLKGLHSRKVRHLDLKPANFVLDCRGEVYIIDFGCAYREYGNKTEPVLKGGSGDSYYFSPERLAFYRKKMLKRLPNLVNPELADQFDGEKVDIWALGVSMLELYMEQLAFLDGPNSLSINTRVELWGSQFFSDRFAGILGWESAAPNSLIGLVKRLLVIDPKHRLTAVSALKQPLFSDPKFTITQNELSRLMSDLIKWKTEPPRNVQNNKDNSPRPHYSGVNYDLNYLAKSPNYYDGYGITSELESAESDDSSDTADRSLSNK